MHIISRKQFPKSFIFFLNLVSCPKTWMNCQKKKGELSKIFGWVGHNLGELFFGWVGFWVSCPKSHIIKYKINQYEIWHDVRIQPNDKVSSESYTYVVLARWTHPIFVYVHRKSRLRIVGNQQHNYCFSRFPEKEEMIILILRLDNGSSKKKKKKNSNCISSLSFSVKMRKNKIQIMHVLQK